MGSQKGYLLTINPKPSAHVKLIEKGEHEDFFVEEVTEKMGKLRLKKVEITLRRLVVYTSGENFTAALEVHLSS